MTDSRIAIAAEWASRLDNGNADTRALFEEWRAEPANDDAWRAVEDARCSAVALADHPDLLLLRHAAIARAIRDRPRRNAPGWWAIAAAACVICIAPVAWMVVSDEREAAVPTPAPGYRTEVGQRLAVTLPDGSRLTLDTASAVRLAYSASERRLILERGQALFEVAKHQRRPFIVVAGGQEVTAHGTQFDVRVRPQATEVALIEGKVSVAPSGMPHGPATPMVVDDVLTATTTSVSVQHVPGKAAAFANWSEGRLVFVDQTLASAVDEINRYSTQAIRIMDPQAARLRISGSFQTGEVEPFLSALQAGFPVSVQHRRPGSIQISYRS